MTRNSKLQKRGSEEATAGQVAVKQFQTASRGRGSDRVPLQTDLVEHIGEAKQQLPLVLMATEGFTGQQQLISFSATDKAAALRTPLRNGISFSGINFASQNPSVLPYNSDLNLAPHSALFRQMILQWLELEMDARVSALMTFDLERNIYTTQRSPGLCHKVAIEYQLQFQEDDRESPRDNAISIQPTGEVEVDLGALAAHYHSSSSTDPLFHKLRFIQALNIARKYGAQQRWDKLKQLGACLFCNPHEIVLCRLTEAFKSCLATFSPSAFPGSLSLLWMPGWALFSCPVIMEETLKARVPLNRKESSKKFDLRNVRYNQGVYEATIESNWITGPAVKEKFECDVKMVKIQQFFEQKMSIKLQRPDFRRVWLGSRAKRKLVPIECGRGKNVPSGTVLDSSDCWTK